MLEGLFAGEEDVEDEAKREDVAFFGVPVSIVESEDFGGYKARCTASLIKLILLLHISRQTKIDNTQIHYIPLIPCDNVLGFDISMHDALSVESLYRLKETIQHAGDNLFAGNRLAF